MEADVLVEAHRAAVDGQMALRRQRAGLAHRLAAAAGCQHAGPEDGERRLGRQLEAEQQVTHRRLHRVGGVGHPAQRARVHHQLLRVRPALGLVAVEQRIAGQAAQHQIELPRQVGAVAHARAGPLAQVRRVGVGRVAGEEDAPHPPGLGQPALEGVDEVADQCHIGLTQPVELLQQPVGRFGCLHGFSAFAGQQRKLEALAPAAYGHEHVAALRVAHLHGVLVELGRERPLRLGVHAQPPLVEAEVVAFDAQAVAHKAVGTIGAHEVARAQPNLAFHRRRRFLSLVPGAAGERHPLGVLLKRGGEVAAVQPHVGHGRDALVDGLFDVRLMHRNVIVPQHAARVARGHVDQQLAFAVDPVVVRRGPGLAQRVVAIGGQ